jgi:hypothetical protein
MITLKKSFLSFLRKYEETLARIWLILKKRTKFPKILIYVLSALFLLFLGVSGFWLYQKRVVKQIPSTSPIPPLSPSSEVNADWETYTNGVFSYQIDYPRDWRVEEFHEGTGVHFISLGDGDVIYLECSRDTKLPEEQEGHAFGEGYITHYVKYLDLKGMKAVQSIAGPIEIWDYAPWFHTYFIEPGRPNRCNMFKYLSFDFKEGEEIDFELAIDGEQIYNLMLSTFKFLDENEDNFKNGGVFEGRARISELDKGKFTLQYPEGCYVKTSSSKFSNIICEGENFKFSLDPGSPVLPPCPADECEVSQVKLGKVTWEKLHRKSPEVSFYYEASFKDDEVYIGSYIIGFSVGFEKYSLQGEELAEQIISSFALKTTN